MPSKALPFGHLQLLATSDPEEVLAFGKSVGQAVERIGVPEKTDGNWHCEISCLTLSSSYISATATSSYEVEGAPLDRFTVIHTLQSAAQIGSVRSSRLVESGTPFILPKDDALFRPKDGFVGLVHDMSRAEVVQAIEQQEGDPNRVGLAQGSFRSGSSELLAYARALQHVATLHERHRDLILDEDAFAKRSHDFLIYTLAADLVQGAPLPEMRDSDMVLFRRARDYIEAEFIHPIRVTDIASYCSCSVRRLLFAFQRTAGTTIVAYLYERRLERARLLLTYARPNDTVTSIAIQSGFIHLGEFSLRYRAKYGETPSSTLRRSPFRVS